MATIQEIFSALESLNNPASMAQALNQDFSSREHNLISDGMSDNMWNAGQELANYNLPDPSQVQTDLTPPMWLNAPSQVFGAAVNVPLSTAANIGSLGDRYLKSAYTIGASAYPGYYEGDTYMERLGNAGIDIWDKPWYSYDPNQSIYSEGKILEPTLDVINGIPFLKPASVGAKAALSEAVRVPSSSVRSIGKGLLTHSAAPEGVSLSSLPADDALLAARDGMTILSKVNKAGQFPKATPDEIFDFERSRWANPEFLRTSDLEREAMSNIPVAQVSRDAAALRKFSRELGRSFDDAGTLLGKELAGESVIVPTLLAAQNGINAELNDRPIELPDINTTVFNPVDEDAIRAAYINPDLFLSPYGRQPTSPSTPNVQAGTGNSGTENSSADQTPVSGTGFTLGDLPGAPNLNQGEKNVISNAIQTGNVNTLVKQVTGMSDSALSKVFKEFGQVSGNLDQLQEEVETTLKSAAEKVGNDMSNSFWSTLGWLITIPFAIRRGISPDELWDNMVQARLKNNATLNAGERALQRIAEKRERLLKGLEIGVDAFTALDRNNAMRESTEADKALTDALNRAREAELIAKANKLNAEANNQNFKSNLLYSALGGIPATYSPFVDVSQIRAGTGELDDATQRLLRLSQTNKGKGK